MRQFCLSCAFLCVLPVGLSLFLWVFGGGKRRTQKYRVPVGISLLRTAAEVVVVGGWVEWVTCIPRDTMLLDSFGSGNPLRIRVSSSFVGGWLV